ncbi:hypothetical protein PRO82_000611 [Candidatus Protochlamydia amoebophila]|nr:hypothetical protein [Candidatus Protochlamydia amoebophila]
MLVSNFLAAATQMQKEQTLHVQKIYKRKKRFLGLWIVMNKLRYYAVYVAYLSLLRKLFLWAKSSKT